MILMNITLHPEGQEDDSKIMDIDFEGETNPYQGDFHSDDEDHDNHTVLAGLFEDWKFANAE